MPELHAVQLPPSEEDDIKTTAKQWQRLGVNTSFHLVTMMTFGNLS